MMPSPTPCKTSEGRGSACSSRHLITDHYRPRDVIVKLLAFTFAMIVVPIGSYFVTVNTVFKGE